MKKVKIISIVGSGRSGSTILSILLSQNKDVFNLGQSRDLWKALDRDVTCTCSRVLRDCSFWSRVAKAGTAGNTHMDLSQYNRQTRAFMQDAKGVINWADKDAIHSLKMKHCRYFEILQRMCSAYSEISGVDTFVDSSKSPETALAFSLLENVELYVLNLVRDPRAVACSWEKKHHNREQTIRFSQEWKRRQDVLSDWSHALGEKYLRIRYEDFVISPRDILTNVLAWAGAETRIDYFTSESTASISWDGQHLFPPANESVLSKKEVDIAIYEPQEWKKVQYHSIHDDAIRHTLPASLDYISESK